MNNKPSNIDFVRLQGWLLVALYGSLAALSLLLLYALFMLYASFRDQILTFSLTSLVTLAAAYFNTRTCASMFAQMKREAPIPHLALNPLLLMALSLLFTGRMFGGL